MCLFFSVRSRFKYKKDLIARPLSTLLEKWRVSKPSNSSKQKKKRRQMDVDSLDYLLYSDEDSGSEDQDEQSTAAVTNWIKSDFSEHTVKFITEGPSFFEDPDNYGISDCTVSSVCSDSDSDNDSYEEDEDIETDTQEGYMHLNRKRKRKTHKLPDNVTDMLKRSFTNKTNPSKKRKVATEKMQELASKMERAWESYCLYSKKTSQYHRSYNWLLEVFSQHIFVSKETLSKTVGFVEAFVMQGELSWKDKKTLGGTHLNCLNKMRNYFSDGWRSDFG